MSNSALLEPPRFVVFDFDGVLADTVQAWFSIVVEELALHGADTTVDELLIEHRGMVIDDSVPVFERTFSISLPPDWASQVVARAVPEVERRFTPIPGGAEAVRAVAGAGLPVAVASGSVRRALVSGIDRLGIAGIVSQRIVSSHDDGRHKPLPDVYLKACGLLNQHPEHGVAVEDSPTGVASARAAGLTVVGFAGDADTDVLLAAGARIVIRRMAELPDVLSL